MEIKVMKLNIEQDRTGYEQEIPETCVGIDESLTIIYRDENRAGTIVSVIRAESLDKLNFLENATEIAMHKDKTVGSMSDGYHTFDELYDFRKAYNACLFNIWYKQGMYGVHKSKRHSDGEECFGGGWFVVSCNTPYGQITNHYEMKDWDLFKCKTEEKAHPWDGHSAKDALERLLKVATIGVVK